MKAFLLYENQKPLIEELSMEERGILLTALFEYKKTGNIIEMTQACRIVFKRIVNQINIDEEKYQEKCRKNSENAKRRWQQTPKQPEFYDPADPRIEKCFEIYSQVCSDLPRLRYERRARDVRDLVAQFLNETGGDFDYFKEVCQKANKQKVICNNTLDFKSVIKNHIAINNEKFKKGGIVGLQFND